MQGAPGNQPVTPPSVDDAVEAIEHAGGLATPREIAAEWGISEQAIAERLRRDTFPEPVKVAGRVRLYLRDQVAPYRHGAPAVLGEEKPEK